MVTSSDCTILFLRCTGCDYYQIILYILLLFPMLFTITLRLLWFDQYIVASGICIHMYLEVGMTYLYRLALRYFIAWPEQFRTLNRYFVLIIP